VELNICFSQTRSCDFYAFKAVVPKLFRAVTQIKIAIRSYYPQYFAVIAHNIEQNCGFGSALSPEQSHYPLNNRTLPLGSNLPPAWEPLI